MARNFAALVAACTLLVSAGCIKIRLTVKLNEDGTGQVIEDILLTKKLVDVAKRLKDAPQIDEITSMEYMRKRASNMGEGVSLAKREVVKKPDGSVRVIAVYKFEDISELRLAPLPKGSGWEDVKLTFHFQAHPGLAAEYFLNIRTPNYKRQQIKRPPPLSQLESQQIRRLLPVFKDLLKDFELKLRLEIYDKDKWASATRGHMATYQKPLPRAGGRLTIFHLTDKHLFASEEGMMMVIPWRQLDREGDLYQHGYPPGPRIMPHVNYLDNGAFRFHWRSIQKSHGREYY